MQIGFLKNYNNNFKQFFVSDLVYYLSNSSDLYSSKYWKKYYILFTIMNRIHTFHIKIEKLWQYLKCPNHKMLYILCIEFVLEISDIIYKKKSDAFMNYSSFNNN